MFAAEQAGAEIGRLLAPFFVLWLIYNFFNKLNKSEAAKGVAKEGMLALIRRWGR